MKIVDDQLKIIDEVPTSAVEMQVKEKVRIQCNKQTECCHFLAFFCFLLVFEKGAATGKGRRGNQDGVETSLQQEANQ